MSRAVVLVSGGLDSATTLAIARDQGFECHALTVDYGQRHRAELEAAGRVARALGAREHRVVRVDLGSFGGSALTDADIAVPTARAAGEVSGAGTASPSAIPVTYVPARNTVMLSVALSLAEAIGAHDLFTGVNAVDYSGYPDCRPAFIEAFQELANVATREGVEGRPFRIHAPLIRLSKSEIVERGTALGIDYGLTVTCYDPDDDGRACGVCEACVLRRRGFEEAGVPDPTRYR